MATADLKNLDYAVLQQCMHCGMCLPTCPTYDETGRERNSPRGRIALMRAVADGDLEMTEEFGREMDYCLGCLACQSACPAGVDYVSMFETARAAAVDDDRKNGRSIGGRFWRMIMLRGVFMRPAVLTFIGWMLRLYQRTYLDRIFRKLLFSWALPKRWREMEKLTPRMSDKFSHEVISTEEGSLESRYRVGLLTGCVQSLAFADVNRATADVLLENGCDVVTPPKQPCCGSLHAHNGEPTLAAELARQMIDKFDVENLDAIITNAAGCGSHLKHYGKLLRGDPAYADRARKWDSKVRDIHEFLVEVGFRKPVRSSESKESKIAYHEPCHLCHGQGIREQPRQILRSIPGLEMKELPEADWCCGSAGIYSITQPEQSKKLLQRKIGHVCASEIDHLATANPGCHLQLESGLRQTTVKVVQPIVLLADAYKDECSEIE